MRETILMKKNSGFTLIELMVTIAIVAIVTAITIPNIISWLPNYRLGTASRGILSVLQQVRLRAVKDNAVAFIQFNPGSNSYTVTLANTPSKNKDMPAGIDLNNTTFAADRVSFNGRGLPNPAFGGTVTIQNSNGTIRQIIVNQTGNSRIN